MKDGSISRDISTGRTVVSLFAMATNIEGTFLMDRDTVRVCIPGKTEGNTRVNLLRIHERARAPWSIQIRTFTRVRLYRDADMEKDDSFLPMEACMKDRGRVVNITDLVHWCSTTEAPTLAWYVYFVLIFSVSEIHFVSRFFCLALPV